MCHSNNFLKLQKLFSKMPILLHKEQVPCVLELIKPWEAFSPFDIWSKALKDSFPCLHMLAIRSMWHFWDICHLTTYALTAIIGASYLPKTKTTPIQCMVQAVQLWELFWSWASVRLQDSAVQAMEKIHALVQTKRRKNQIIEDQKRRSVTYLIMKMLSDPHFISLEKRTGSWKTLKSSAESQLKIIDISESEIL